MNSPFAVPTTSYGILERTETSSQEDEIAEQIATVGYATLRDTIPPDEVRKIADEFDRVRARYIEQHGERNLGELDELYTIRAPLTLGGDVFLRLALNATLIATIQRLIKGKFILNQQNGIINPPNADYNQGLWHRDLPYQHFVSSNPLAINALYCVDDFSKENGATFVIPASHKSAKFASPSYVARHAVQIEAQAGDFILLDCMTFHSGGRNTTTIARRGINHVFTIPFFKQQIRIPESLDHITLTNSERELLGFTTTEPLSVSDYLAGRRRRIKNDG